MYRSAALIALLAVTVAGCSGGSRGGPTETAEIALATPPAGSTPGPGSHATAYTPPTPPGFQRYSVGDGLSSGFVKGLLQDRRGFLWAATADGVARFDGVSFDEFFHDPSDPTSLSQNHTNRLAEDDLGAIWVGHVSGVDRFDPVTETFAPALAASPTPDRMGAVYGLANGSDGRVWVASTGRGLVWIDPASGTWTPAAFRVATAAPQRLSVVAAAPDGALWLGGRDGLSHYDPVTGALTPIDLDVPSSASPDVWTLHLDRAGTLWVGTLGDGLVRYDPETGRSRVFGPDVLGAGVVNSLAEGPGGVIWVGTNGGGVARYDPTRQTLVRAVAVLSDPTTLTVDNVSALLVDRGSVLWAGTTSGLHRQLPLSALAERHRPRPGVPGGLEVSVVNCFATDAAGRLWMGTAQDGLLRRDPETGAFTGVALPGVGRGAAVYDLAVDASGEVWAASSAGVYRSAGGRFERVPLPDDADGATRLAATDEGPVWIGGRGMFQAGAEGPARRLGDPEAVGSVMDILAGPEGTVDVATFGSGVLRLAPDGRVVASWTHDPADRESLPTSIVTALHRAPSGTLWVGTNGGVGRIDPTSGRVTRYGMDDGLPHPTASDVTDAADGQLWVLTPRGLSRLDPDVGVVATYQASDGLPDGSLMALYRDTETGRVYVGGGGGYVAFDPEQLLDAPPPGPVVLTGLRLGGQPVRAGTVGSVLERPLAETTVLRLGPGDDVVTVEFAALDFAAPAVHRYSVRMGGLSDVWVDAGDLREATFTALPPGRYELQVRAAGREGVWGEPSAPLTVVVAPPWWRTWWAYGAYAMLLAALAVVAVRYRDERQRLAREAEVERKEAEALRHLDRAKTRFFANVSHEFRTPLTLTLGPLDDVLAGEYGPLPDEASETIRLARRSAGRVLSLINQILDVSRLEAGSTALRARRLDLGSFVEAHVAAFAPLAAHRRITVEASTPDAALHVWADPDHLGTILANLLSNAFKFTPAGGAVEVAVEAGERARVTVRDTGPGIGPADLPYVFDRFYQAEGAAGRPAGSGIGLALAHELAALHGGALTAESTVGGAEGEPSGSVFTLALPLGRGHLAPDQVDDRPWDGAAVAGPAAAVDGGPPALPLEADLDDDVTDDDDVTTVLVADDQPDIRAFVRRHLEGAGYRVVEAADGEEALDRVRQRLPDLVVSDVMMPRLDGLGLCRALKADPETGSIPVVLLTAKAAPEDRLDGLAELCDDYLTKPFDPAELRARVSNLIEGRKRLRERFRQEGIALALGDGDGAPGALPEPEAVVSADDAFLAEVRAAVEAGLGDDAFSVGRLAEAVGVSRGHLHRQLTALAGETPSALIRAARLERAASLLAAGAGTVSEVAYAVGFKSVGHFSDSFLEAHGCRPSAYAERDVSAAEEAP